MRFSLLVVALLLSHCVLSQDTPQAVQEAFLKQFPAATEAEWESEEGLYSVVFYDPEIYRIVTYSSDGNWVSTKSYLYSHNLPDNVRKPVEDKYPSGIMTEVVQYDKEKDTQYDIYVLDDINFWFLQLDKSGKILKTEKIPD